MDTLIFQLNDLESIFTDCKDLSMKDIVKIPDYLARMVGKGTMSNKTIVWDYPLLNMVMVNLQNDDSVGAYRYAILTHIPKYMRHMVGNVKAQKFVDEVETEIGVRRVRTPATWVLYPIVFDSEKVTVKNGKRYVKKQVSAFTERYFAIREKEEDFEEVINI